MSCQLTRIINATLRRQPTSCKTNMYHKQIDKLLREDCMYNSLQTNHAGHATLYSSVLYDCVHCVDGMDCGIIIIIYLAVME